MTPLSASRRPRSFASFASFASLVSFLGLAGFALLGAACQEVNTSEEPVGSDEAALSAAQCDFFDVHGKVQICHKTSSVAHPYTILRLSEQGCINGHAAHAGDYVTSTDPASPLYDPTCGGGGCLPLNAPCDATLPCCDGSTCTNGVCVGAPPDLCAEPCPLPGFASPECTVVPCDPATGACGEPDYFTHYKELCLGGTGVCQGGVCHLDLCLASPCQNDGQCFSTPGSTTYTCACAPGYAGASCELVDPCIGVECTQEEGADLECLYYQCNSGNGLCEPLISEGAECFKDADGSPGVCTSGVCEPLP